MRIALVMDDMPVRSNGTSSTALRYADALREQGHGGHLRGLWRG